MGKEAKQQLSDLVAGFSHSLTQLKGDVPPGVVGLWMSFVNGLHGLPLDEVGQRAEATMNVMVAMQQAPQPLLPPPEPRRSLPPAEAKAPPSEQLVLEAGPYTGDRSMLLRDLNMLVRYKDVSGQEVNITDLPTTDLIRVVNGGMAVIMQLLDRVSVPVVHRKLVDEARREIEKGVIAVGRMVEAAEDDPLVTAEIRGGLARSIKRVVDPEEPTDERPAEPRESPLDTEGPALPPPEKPRKKTRNWSEAQRQAARDRMLRIRSENPDRFKQKAIPAA